MSHRPHRWAVPARAPRLTPGRAEAVDADGPMDAQTRPQVLGKPQTVFHKRPPPVPAYPDRKTPTTHPTFPAANTNHDPNPSSQRGSLSESRSGPFLTSGEAPLGIVARTGALRPACLHNKQPGHLATGEAFLEVTLADVCARVTHMVVQHRKDAGVAPDPERETRLHVVQGVRDRVHLG